MIVLPRHRESQDSLRNKPSFPIWPFYLTSPTWTCLSSKRSWESTSLYPDLSCNGSDMKDPSQFEAGRQIQRHSQRREQKQITHGQSPLSSLHSSCFHQFPLQVPGRHKNDRVERNCDEYLLTSGRPWVEVENKSGRFFSKPRSRGD